MVSSNSKFCSFLVWILIRKENTDNKVFKKEFYTKETRKKGIEKISVANFSAICWNLSERVSGIQSSLNLSIFLLFCFVEIFQSSLSCKSSLKFFSAEFSVEFSFNCLTC